MGCSDRWDVEEIEERAKEGERVMRRRQTWHRRYWEALVKNDWETAERAFSQLLFEYNVVTRIP